MNMGDLDWKVVVQLAGVYIIMLTAALLPFMGALLLVKWIFF